MFIPLWYVSQCFIISISVARGQVLIQTTENRFESKNRHLSFEGLGWGREEEVRHGTHRVCVCVWGGGEFKSKDMRDGHWMSMYKN